MTGESVRRVLVWGGLVRGLHWALAASVLVLLATGWLMTGSAPDLEGAAAEVHRNTGYVLLALLASRAYLLLFGQGPEHWRDFIPGPAQRRAAREQLRFYLTGTRAPLPAYYAHSPVWGPLHLALYGLLTFQAATGLLGLMGWHAGMLPVIGALAGLHVVAVFLHDWKGTGSDVSAMISGYRVFVVRRPESGAGAGVQVAWPEGLGRRRRAGEDGGGEP